MGYTTLYLFFVARVFLGQVLPPLSLHQPVHRKTSLIKRCKIWDNSMAYSNSFLFLLIAIGGFLQTE